MGEARVVLKFKVPIDGKWHSLLLPPGATLVHVGNVYPIWSPPPHASDYLHFWAESPDPRDEPVSRSFRAYATGEPITDEAATWAGTFIEDGFVWHLYMKTE